MFAKSAGRLQPVLLGIRVLGQHACRIWGSNWFQTQTVKLREIPRAQILRTSSQAQACGSSPRPGGYVASSFGFATSTTLKLSCGKASRPVVPEAFLPERRKQQLLRSENGRQESFKPLCRKPMYQPGGSSVSLRYAWPALIDVFAHMLGPGLRTFCLGRASAVWSLASDILGLPL